jgi:IS5 family transposase
METQETKAQYRIRNWKEYNAGLVKRGSISFWIEERAISRWYAEHRDNKRGRPYSYADTAIEFMSILKAVYRLPLRATQGFTRSIMQLLRIDLQVPDYSTLSRRRGKLQVKLPVQASQDPIHLVVDSSGIKVYGEGEWKMKLHGKSKRRTWRKLHIGVNEATQEIVAAVITDKDTADKEVAPQLLSQAGTDIAQVSADGGYDYMSVYDAIAACQARATIPPRENARIWDNGQMDARDANIRRIQEIGRKQWKQECAYHRRSLVETAFYRLKRLLGERMNERLLKTQITELRLRCAVLNKFTSLGMPVSYKLSAVA